MLLLLRPDPNESERAKEGKKLKTLGKGKAPHVHLLSRRLYLL
jgi:hypothetical protein